MGNLTGLRTEPCGLVIRDMADSDIEAVREVSVAAVASLRAVYRPSQRALRRRTKRKSRRSGFVCLSDGEIVGSVEYEERDDALHVIGPLVLPSHRRRGIAGLFMDHLTEIGTAKGLRALSLNTVRETGNVEIFKRLGFCALHESPDEWSESVTGEELTDVYMERDLG